MRIGFDAKRAFMNFTGLGNYSRNVIRCLIQNNPENEYLLFTPDISVDEFKEEMDKIPNVTIVQPRSTFFSSYWRSYQITGLINKLQLDVFHGLSNELPFNIQRTKAKKVVTIHDLIPFKEDVFRSPLEDFIFKRKVKSACKKADSIISISHATATDIEYYLSPPKSKMKVVCPPVNQATVLSASAQQLKVKEKYQLPDSFMLQVGRVEYRKNVQIILRALKKLKEDHIHYNYVVVGRKTRFYKSLQSFTENFRLKEQVQFIDPVNNEELEAMYALSKAVLYPSLYEGFGLPVIEAIQHGKPVLTTQGSCFEEAGGSGAIYCDTSDVEEVKRALVKLMEEDHTSMMELGQKHINSFAPAIIARQLMEVYN